VHIYEKPEWYFAYNPRGQAPAFRMANGWSTFESNVVVDFIEERYK